MEGVFLPEDSCPCAHQHHHRYLEEEADGNDGDTEIWQIVYTCFVLFCMFIALISDRIGADHVMLTALTAFMAAEIISISEGLAGFANAGLLTVLVLFVVAEGISKTGALDWYMTKWLGAPKTVASAQLRLMVPIAFVSAFLNNTPVVAVMIPIVQRWARNNRLSAQQLLIPLSFASILGGTCTLIGTSTNLVVVGLLEERYPNDPAVEISLFSLGEYGVPVAMAGMAYILLISPFLLPSGGDGTGSAANEQEEHILLGARLTQWSPAAGRTVQRSGLRDTGGIFLVSVHRAATGNVHRAVSRDFVLNVGDTLYFTGLVESFGEFCEEHGLEVVTNEVETKSAENVPVDEQKQYPHPSQSMLENTTITSLPTVLENPVPVQVGITKESLLQADEEERLRSLYQMTDTIRTGKSDEPPLRRNDPAKIVVAIDHDMVVAGINCRDRPGLLLDISKGLLRLQLQLRHTEAAVVDDRSWSIWRCENISTDLPDVEEIWSVLNALLSTESGIEAVKKRGLRVIRARVVKGSGLVGQTAAQVDFRQNYKAAIVTVLHGITPSSALTKFQVGDMLVLQASEDSALLQRPPEGFYDALEAPTQGTNSRSGSVLSLVNLVTRRGNRSTGDLLDEQEASSHRPAEQDLRESNSGGEDFYIPSDTEEPPQGADVEVGAPSSVARLVELEQAEAVWKDLQVIFPEHGKEKAEAGREFLTAMAVAPKAKLVGKTATEIGINKLPDLFLVSIDRPQRRDEDAKRAKPMVRRIGVLNDNPSVNDALSDDLSDIDTIRTEVFTAITQEDPLKEGDVLWFSGPATAVGDLRKIPGLVSYENEEVEKINEKVFDRRLVQAVVARKGDLVGKTVREIRFRSRYGAAVIAVHREGKRVHEHPGKVKLQAGDVLLLEAGPTFMARSTDHDRSFALLAEVRDSAPPRMALLIPALMLTGVMLVVFTAGISTLLVCGLVAAILMVVFGILSEQEARDAVNWEVYITIAAAFGIGTALVNSGVADAIASFLVDVGTAVGIGDAGLFGAVYFATFLISNVVTNNAAAALLFPIAMEAAEATNTNRVLMSYALMLGASASFMSPFGYTTNLLIYGPGGYKYNDFLIFGTPMQIVLWILSTAYLSVIRPWYVSWIGTGLFLLLVVAGRVCNPALSGLFRGNQDKTNEGKEESAVRNDVQNE